MSGRKRTTDAVKIVHRRFVAHDPEMQAALEEARLSARIARQIHQLRKERGLTQAQLAALVGTQPSAICRLQDEDYDGYTLSTLQRVAEALGQELEVRFVAAPAEELKIS